MNYNILTSAAKNSSSQDQVVKKDIHFHLKLKLTIIAVIRCEDRSNITESDGLYFQI
jgi:hypothetical protein